MSISLSKLSCAAVLSIASNNVTANNEVADVTEIWLEQILNIIAVEYQNNKKQEQTNFDVEPFKSYLDDARSSDKYGAYIQDEIRLTDKKFLNAGARYDSNNYGGDAVNNKQSIVNPRVALIYFVQPEMILKLVYGTAYRNTNSYELYYGSAINYLPSVDIQSEEI